MSLGLVAYGSSESESSDADDTEDTKITAVSKSVVSQDDSQISDDDDDYIPVSIDVGGTFLWLK